MLTNTKRRISICQFSTFKWNFTQDVMRYGTLGFDSIDIWRRKLDDISKEDAIDCVYENKLSVSSVHWAGGFTGDGNSFAEAIDDAIDAIQFSSQIGSDCLILHPGSRNGHTTSHATRLFQTALEELTPVAGDFGVQLALEPTFCKGTNPWTFFDSFEQTLKTLEQFPAEQLGMVLDLFQVGFDYDIMDAMSSFAPRISLVQLADRTSGFGVANRLPLGEGDLPIEQWLQKLHEIGYQGKFEVELHGPDIQGKDYFELLDQTDKYFRDPVIESLIATPAISKPEKPFVIRSNRIDG